MSNNLALHAHRVNLARRWSVQNEPDLVMVRCPGIPYIYNKCHCVLTVLRAAPLPFLTPSLFVSFLLLSENRPPPTLKKGKSLW